MIPTPYEDLLREVLAQGTHTPDRTGTGTRSVFGRQLRFDLTQGFPLITTKRVHFKSVAVELLWFLRGDSNIHWMQNQGVSIWDEWADPNGELGPVYGVQWRSWPAPNDQHIDQIAAVMDSLKADPYSRRHIVSAWNVAEIPGMALPPCHTLFQFHIEPTPSGPDRLSCQLYQRSADLFLGVPFNIGAYSLLTEMIAHQLGLAAGEFIWTGGDCHIYDNHIDQVREQILRAPFPSPRLSFRRRPDTLFDYTCEDLQLLGYRHHPAIAAPVAV